MATSMNLRSILKFLWTYRGPLIFILTPLVLLPLPLVLDTSEAKCAYVMILMAIYWMTEVIHLAVTSLIPVLLFPLIGLVGSKDVCVNYIKDISMMLIGGLIVAIAIEHSNLHKRIAIRILMLLGTQTRWLLLGFMLPTYILSMWISNTATTAMMIPIAMAVVDTLYSEVAGRNPNQSDPEQSASLQPDESESFENDDIRRSQSTGDVNPSIYTVDSKATLARSESEIEIEDSNNTKNQMKEKASENAEYQAYMRLSKAMCLCVAYSANVGGIGTLTGTPPNLVLKEFIDGKATLARSESEIEIEDSNNTKNQMKEKASENAEYQAYMRLSKAMCLCVAYSANVGGIGTLTGTPPNLVLKEFIDGLYEDRGLEQPVTFTSWMVFGIPLSAMCVVVCWVWLQIYFLGFRGFFNCRANDKATAERVRAVIKKEYDSLGSIKFNEMAVFIHFVILVLLWFFRKPGFISGWGSLFPKGFATDATAAIAVSMSLFMFPSRRPHIFHCGKRTGKLKSVPALLDWKTVSAKMPWSLIILIGGGFALADASKRSGLTAAIGESLEVFGSLPTWVVNLLVNSLVAGLTEFTSNTATTTLVIPIIANLANNIGVNTLYLTLPAAVSASFAFMLPVATGPNAVVFSYGNLRIADMMKCGFLMNILCIGLVTLATNTYGTAYFKWDTPAWGPANMTTPTAPAVNQTGV